MCALHKLSNPSTLKFEVEWKIYPTVCSDKDLYETCSGGLTIKRAFCSIRDNLLLFAKEHLLKTSKNTSEAKESELYPP